VLGQLVYGDVGLFGSFSAEVFFFPSVFLLVCGLVWCLNTFAVCVLLLSRLALLEQHSIVALQHKKDT